MEAYFLSYSEPAEGLTSVQYETQNVLKHICDVTEALTLITALSSVRY